MLDYARALKCIWQMQNQGIQSAFKAHCRKKTKRQRTAFSKARAMPEADLTAL
jgi:hypothetical protein